MSDMLDLDSMDGSWRGLSVTQLRACVRSRIACLQQAQSDVQSLLVAAPTVDPNSFTLQPQPPSQAQSQRPEPQLAQQHAPHHDQPIHEHQPRPQQRTQPRPASQAQPQHTESHDQPFHEHQPRPCAQQHTQSQLQRIPQHQHSQRHTKPQPNSPERSTHKARRQTPQLIEPDTPYTLILRKQRLRPKPEPAKAAVSRKPVITGLLTRNNTSKKSKGPLSPTKQAVAPPKQARSQRPANRKLDFPGHESGSEREAEPTRPAAVEGGREPCQVHVEMPSTSSLLGQRASPAPHPIDGPPSDRRPPVHQHHDLSHSFAPASSLSASRPAAPAHSPDHPDDGRRAHTPNQHHPHQANGQREYYPDQRYSHQDDRQRSHYPGQHSADQADGQRAHYQADGQRASPHQQRAHSYQADRQRAHSPHQADDGRLCREHLSRPQSDTGLDDRRPSESDLPSCFSFSGDTERTSKSVASDTLYRIRSPTPETADDAHATAHTPTSHNSATNTGGGSPENIYACVQDSLYNCSSEEQNLSGSQHNVSHSDSEARRSDEGCTGEEEEENEVKRRTSHSGVGDSDTIASSDGSSHTSPSTLRKRLRESARSTRAPKEPQRPPRGPSPQKQPRGASVPQGATDAVQPVLSPRSSPGAKKMPTPTTPTRPTLVSKMNPHSPTAAATVTSAESIRRSPVRSSPTTARAPSDQRQQKRQPHSPSLLPAQSRTPRRCAQDGVQRVEEEDDESGDESLATVRQRLRTMKGRGPTASGELFDDTSLGFSSDCSVEALSDDNQSDFLEGSPPSFSTAVSTLITTLAELDRCNMQALSLASRRSPPRSLVPPSPPLPQSQQFVPPSPPVALFHGPDRYADTAQAHARLLSSPNHGHLNELGHRPHHEQARRPHDDTLQASPLLPPRHSARTADGSETTAVRAPLVPTRGGGGGRRGGGGGDRQQLTPMTLRQRLRANTHTDVVDQIAAVAAAVVDDDDGNDAAGSSDTDADADTDTDTDADADDYDTHHQFVDRNFSEDGDCAVADDAVVIEGEGAATHAFALPSFAGDNTPPCLTPSLTPSASPQRPPRPPSHPVRSSLDNSRASLPRSSASSSAHLHSLRSSLGDNPSFSAPSLSNPFFPAPPLSLRSSFAEHQPSPLQGVAYNPPPLPVAPSPPLTALEGLRGEPPLRAPVVAAPALRLRGPREQAQGHSGTRDTSEASGPFRSPESTEARGASAPRENAQVAGSDSELPPPQFHLFATPTSSQRQPSPLHPQQVVQPSPTVRFRLQHDQQPRGQHQQHQQHQHQQHEHRQRHQQQQQHLSGQQHTQQPLQQQAQEATTTSLLDSTGCFVAVEFWIASTLRRYFEELKRQTLGMKIARGCHEWALLRRFFRAWRISSLLLKKRAVLERLVGNVCSFTKVCSIASIYLCTAVHGEGTLRQTDSLESPHTSIALARGELCFLAGCGSQRRHAAPQHAHHSESSHLSRPHYWVTGGSLMYVAFRFYCRRLVSVALGALREQVQEKHRRYEPTMLSFATRRARRLLRSCWLQWLHVHQRHVGMVTLAQARAFRLLGRSFDVWARLVRWRKWARRAPELFKLRAIEEHRNNISAFSHFRALVLKKVWCYWHRTHLRSLKVRKAVQNLTNRSKAIAFTHLREWVSVRRRARVEAGAADRLHLRHKWRAWVLALAHYRLECENQRAKMARAMGFGRASLCRETLSRWKLFCLRNHSRVKAVSALQKCLLRTVFFRWTLYKRRCLAFIVLVSTRQRQAAQRCVRWWLACLASRQGFERRVLGDHFRAWGDRLRFKAHRHALVQWSVQSCNTHIIARCFDHWRREVDVNVFASQCIRRSNTVALSDCFRVWRRHVKSIEASRQKRWQRDQHVLRVCVCAWRLFAEKSRGFSALMLQAKTAYVAEIRTIGFKTRKAFLHHRAVLLRFALLEWRELVRRRRELSHKFMVQRLVPVCFFHWKTQVFQAKMQRIDEQTRKLRQFLAGGGRVPRQLAYKSEAEGRYEHSGGLEALHDAYEHLPVKGSSPQRDELDRAIQKLEQDLKATFPKHSAASLNAPDTRAAHSASHASATTRRPSPAASTNHAVDHAPSVPRNDPSSHGNHATDHQRPSRHTSLLVEPHQPEQPRRPSSPRAHVRAASPQPSTSQADASRPLRSDASSKAVQRVTTREPSPQIVRARESLHHQTGTRPATHSAVRRDSDNCDSYPSRWSEPPGSLEADRPRDGRTDHARRASSQPPQLETQAGRPAGSVTRNGPGNMEAALQPTALTGPARRVPASSHSPGGREYHGHVKGRVPLRSFEAVSNGGSDGGVSRPAQRPQTAGPRRPGSRQQQAQLARQPQANGKRPPPQHEGVSRPTPESSSGSLSVTDLRPTAVKIVMPSSAQFPGRPEFVVGQRDEERIQKLSDLASSTLRIADSEDSLNSDDLSVYTDDQDSDSLDACSWDHATSSNRVCASNTFVSSGPDGCSPMSLRSAPSDSP